MRKFRGLLLDIFLFLLSTIIFLFLESGFPPEMDALIKPLIFSTAVVIAFRTNLRKYLLMVALLFLIIMVFFYSFWQISLLEWFGSTGFGMLVIYVASLIPQLIKKGFVEKF